MIHHQKVFAPHCNASSRRKAGFTLVELCITVGIIGVLLTLLLPAISGARRAARSTTCLSNLRQLQNGFLLYVQDNGQAMAAQTYPHQYWHEAIAPYLGDPLYASQPGVGDHPSMRVLLCPEASTYLAVYPSPADTYGSARSAWNWGDGDLASYGSYGINLWLIPIDGEFRDNNDPPGYLTADRYYPNWASAAPASNVPVLADSVWMGSWPDSADVPPSDLNLGNCTHAVGVFMDRFCIDRHHRAINVSFADGSVRHVALGDLWQLDWHRGWQPRTVIIP